MRSGTKMNQFLRMFSIYSYCMWHGDRVAHVARTDWEKKLEMYS